MNHKLIKFYSAAICNSIQQKSILLNVNVTDWDVRISNNATSECVAFDVIYLSDNHDFCSQVLKHVLRTTSGWVKIEKSNNQILQDFYRDALEKNETLAKSLLDEVDNMFGPYIIAEYIGNTSHIGKPFATQSFRPNDSD